MELNVHINYFLGISPLTQPRYLKSYAYIQGSHIPLHVEYAKEEKVGDTAALPAVPWESLTSAEVSLGADAHTLTVVSRQEKAHSLICTLCCGSQVR